MSDKPKDTDVDLPWIVQDCKCAGRCDFCDGHTWYYRNIITGQTVSEMMRSAMERHG